MKPYYRSKGITIYHGDCREVLGGIRAAVDLVLTDPPYGVDLKRKKTKHTAALHTKGPGYLSIVDSPDLVRDCVVPVVQECIERWSRVVVMPGARNLMLYPQPRDLGGVFCGAGAGLSSWGFNTLHPILYYGRCPYLAKGLGSRPNGFNDTQRGETVEGHPCPKPLRWMEWLVKKASHEGETILDPFMGSGTTLVAARNLNRKAIGIELEEKYCEIAANRLEGRALAKAA